MKWPNIGSSLNAQNIVVLWATGKVWKVLVEQIQERDQIENWHTHPTHPFILAGSKKILIAKPGEVRGILDPNWTERYDTEWVDNPNWYDGIFDAINEVWLHPEQVVFVDVTNDGSPENLAFYKKVITSWAQLVTANKWSLATSSMDDFRFLTRDRSQIWYRWSVMAGGPAVRMAQNARDTRTRIRWFDAVMSGTMNDIPNSMENGLSFSDSMQEAQRKWFAETDIWLDLSGKDVWSKSIILPRSGDIETRINDLQITPFIPQEFAAYKWEQFWEEVTKRLDPEYKRRIELLQKKNKVIRYISSIRVLDDEQVEIKIGPKEVDKNSSFWKLSGSQNRVVMYTEVQPDGESYERRWAWLDVTANSVRADIAERLSHITA